MVGLTAAAVPKVFEAGGCGSTRFRRVVRNGSVPGRGRSIRACLVRYAPAEAASGRPIAYSALTSKYVFWLESPVTEST